MGQLVTTIVGGVIGFLIGGPMGASIGMALGGMVGATLFGPTIKGPRLNDLKVSSSTYGIAIPEIYGTVRLSTNLIWTTGIKETKKTRRAGKGGPKVETYSYDASFALGLCKGPIREILRIWADSKLIYDVSNNGTRNPLNAGQSGILAPVLLSFRTGGTKKKRVNLRIYLGNEEQLPDSLIEADKGVGNVSAHRGLAYVVFERLQLEDFGNRIPQFTMEVTKAPAEAFPSVEQKEGPAGTVAQPDARNWFPDWENGKVYSSIISNDAEDAYTEVFDLNTMQNMQRWDRSNMWFTGRYGFAPWAGIFMQDDGGGNSRPLGVYSLSTGARIGLYGQSSRSLSGYYVESGPARGALAVAANFGNQATVTLDGKYIMLAGWTRDNWILTRGGTPVGWYEGAWSPFHLMPALGSVWGWRSGNSGLQIADFISGGIGQYSLAPPDSNGNVFWRQGGSLAFDTTLRPLPGETYVPSICLFDPSDGHFFSIGRSNNGSRSIPVAFKYSPITGLYKFINADPEILVPNGPMQWSRLNGGTFGYIADSLNRNVKVNLQQINLQNGEIVRDSRYGSTWGGPIYVRADQHWDDVSSSIITTTKDTFRRIWFNSNAKAVRLSDVVRDIATKSNVLTVDELDTTNLFDQEIIGFSIDRQSSAMDALKLLATGYMFDAYESDYKLKFRTRGRDSEVVIPQDWIARSSDEFIKENIVQELEMPLKVTVNYYDTARDHQQGSQSSRRNAGPFPTMWTAKEDIIDLPLVWTPDMAKQSADKLLKMAWANRVGLQFTLPWRYLKYEPSDIITLTTDTATYFTRLTETTIGQDFSIEASGVTDKASAYVSTKVGSRVDSPEQIIEEGYPAFPIVINTPLLRDEDYDTSGASICFVSAGTNAFTFSGAAIYVYDGIEDQRIGFIGADTVRGRVINELPYTTAYESTDETTVLKVVLNNPNDELESVTQLDMLNFDMNAALVGEEVIQFRDAVQQPDGEWWLTGLRRARRGTNYALRNHQPNELFLLLEPEAVTSFPRPPEAYVTTTEFLAVTPGQLITDAIPVLASLQPRDLMPYTPEDIKIDDDGSDVTITVQRRSRIIAPLRDGISNIHFKEGAKQTSKIACQIWPGRGFEVVDTALPPTLVENVSIFDANGQDLPLEIIFPLSTLGASTVFLARITEQGVVDGIAKWIKFERVGAGRWNQTEFY
jgi:hypothetical protein